MVAVKTALSLGASASSLTVTLDFITPVEFKSHKNINGFQLTVIAIAIDAANEVAHTASEILPVQKLTSEIPLPISATLQIPVESKTILICVKCEGCDDGELANNIRTKGMGIVKALELSEIDKGK
jgi:hypothetical protein